MAAIEINTKGLQEAIMTIPQSTSVSFNLIHVDDDKNTIDHSGSTCHMALQSTDKATTYVLDGCCTCSAERIHVNIPATITGSLPLGKYNWDMIVDTALGESVRALYGVARVIDTYAKDEV